MLTSLIQVQTWLYPPLDCLTSNHQKNLNFLKIFCNLPSLCTVIWGFDILYYFPLLYFAISHPVNYLLQASVAWFRMATKPPPLLQNTNSQICKGLYWLPLWHFQFMKHILIYYPTLKCRKLVSNCFCHLLSIPDYLHWTAQFCSGLVYLVVYEEVFFIKVMNEWMNKSCFFLFSITILL